MRTIEEILVDRLLTDLNGRRGFDTGYIDDDVMEEWKAKWVEIIKEALNDDH